MRRFREWLQWLPERSAFRVATGPEGVSWTGIDELLTQILEVVSIGATADTRLREPVKGWRPRYAEPAPEASAPAEVAAFFGMAYIAPPAESSDDQEETDA